MSEPICPGCDGTGAIHVQINSGKDRNCEIWFNEVQSCPMCEGSGIATDYEVEQFKEN